MRLVWLIALLLVPAGARAADPSALWKIVNGKCVPHEQAADDPSPCAAVDVAGGVDKGFAVLKDMNGVAQFLLIPTARIGGIEDPAILRCRWRSIHRLGGHRTSCTSISTASGPTSMMRWPPGWTR
jgi:CDP-diacylglycerol pyrophosphatase